MSKDNISDFDATPVNNSDIGGINIAENCPPSNINDAIRRLMTAIKAGDWGGATINANASTATNAAGADSADIAETLKQGGITAPTSAGTSTAYTVTSSPVVAAYASGAVYQFKAHTACGASPTVNFDGLGAKSIKRISDGAKVSMQAGDIPSGALVQCLYDGTDMVAAVAPRMRGFSAIKSAAQTGIAAGFVIKVTFPTEEWDTDGWYDAANSKFLPTEAGYYAVSVSLSYTSGIVDANPHQALIYKNGSHAAVGSESSSGVTQTVPTVTRAFYMNGTTDYLEVYCLATGAGDKTVNNDGGTFFQAHKIAS